MTIIRLAIIICMFTVSTEIINIANLNLRQSMTVLV